MIRRLSVIIMAILTAQMASGQKATLSSPDGRVKINVTASGKTTFSIDYGKARLVEDSRVGIEFADGIFLGGGSYELTVFADAEDTDTNPNNLVKTVRTVTSADKVDIHLASRGGVAMILKNITTE